jgi:hypothetical protein
MEWASDVCTVYSEIGRQKEIKREREGERKEMEKERVEKERMEGGEEWKKCGLNK